MTINYRNLFLALIAAILIAIPTAIVLQNKNQAIEANQSENNRLKLDIQKKDKQIEQVQDEADQRIDELEQKNKKLEEDLQAKAKRKAEEQRIAAARQPAAVSSPSVGTSGNCESYRALVAKYFPAGQVNNALLTMQKESSCRPTAVSPTNDHGLMQVNCTYHCAKVGGDVNRLYDPETNIRLAAQIYSDRGNWSAWYAVRGILW